MVGGRNICEGLEEGMGVRGGGRNISEGLEEGMGVRGEGKEWV